MDIKTIVASASETDAKAALDYMLDAYMTPSFGALPKSEVELIMLNVLEKLGAISAEPELYELVAKLKITRSKARRFIYDRDLRRSTAEELDEKIKHGHGIWHLFVLAGSFFQFFCIFNYIA